MSSPTNTPNRHRSHRRRKKSGGNAGKIGIAGAVTGVVAIAAVAGGFVLLRPDGDDESPVTPRSATGPKGGDGGLPSVKAPATGGQQTFNTPEGYGYALGATKAGVTTTPPKTAENAPGGSRFAYAEYVLTNTQRRPVLLDYPADLFLPRSQVDGKYLARCMPQPGIPDSMCTLPNHSAVIARVGDASAPVQDDGDTMMPAGASYVVRIATDLPVKSGVKPGDLRLYVWNARYTSERKGIPLDFP